MLIKQFFKTFFFGLNWGLIFLPKDFLVLSNALGCAIRSKSETACTAARSRSKFLTKTKGDANSFGFSFMSEESSSKILEKVLGYREFLDKMLLSAASAKGKERVSQV